MSIVRSMAPVRTSAETSAKGSMLLSAGRCFAVFGPDIVRLADADLGSSPQPISGDHLP